MHCQPMLALYRPTVYAYSVILHHRIEMRDYEGLAALIGRRRVRREVSAIEHRPQQRGFRQDGLRLGDHFRGGVLAAQRNAHHAAPARQLVIVRQALGAGGELT